ncbi:hypothetical protein ACLI08_15325 [Flavobacterium sp. RNTU_13]|uniref:hypothetical protein n=1 Tax=Flavobacterium sp. RNTU_13 TaxID=3375145 RepID=UPI00398613EC
MKKLNLAAVVALSALALTSCKDESKMKAEQKVDQYVSFVDSVNNVAAEERAANWAAIQHEYEVMTAKADSSLAVLENDAKTSEKIQEAKAKYEGIKTQAEETVKAQADKAQAAVATGANKVADALFGANNVKGDDKSFAWVNKDNILKVYQDFYENFKTNRDSYSREELDMIKAWYEALDARKNTVEKEGLSSKDNMKIAEIKLKFAPMFKWDRLTAKGEENEEAKKSAN